MKRYQAVLLVFPAVFAVAVVTAGAASAETTLLAEWLVSGVGVTALTSVETSGEVLVATLVLGVEAVDILCSGIFDGSVGPSGEDEITAVLTLSGVEVGKELVGTPLSCTVDTSVGKECGEVGGLAEIWVDGLPWHGLLVLMESGEFLGLGLGTTPGYHVLCSNGKENLCNGPTSALLSNTTGGVLGVFSAATSQSVPCTTGTGDQVGEGITASLGTTLTVSSE
jgi:hypothetical protein